MADTVNLGITQLTEGQSQKEITINTGFEGFDKAIAGKLVKDIAGGVDVTLTTTEWQSTMLEFTGALTANISVIVPTTTRRFSAFNNTTGAFTLTLKTAAGTGIEVPQTERLLLEQTGAGVVFLGGGGGSMTLLDLTDVPDSYTGQAGKVLAVNVGETGTEFITPAAGGETLWARTVPGAPSWYTGLLGWWKLEEASGNRVDSVGTNHLVPQGTVGTITNAAGKIGQALAMNGTSGTYLSVADNATLSSGANQSFTVACWVYVTNTGTSMGFVGKGSFAASGTLATIEYQLWQASTAWRFSVGNGSVNTDLASSFTPVANQWYLLIGWYDDVANLQYIQVNNGTPDQTANAAGSYDSTHPFEVGRTAGITAQVLNGRVDMVGFWKRLLTAPERTALYNSGNGADYGAGAIPSVSPVTITDQLLLAPAQTTTEKLEVDGGIKVGNSTGTTDGTIRWTGTDLEVRKAGAWVSLTT